MPIMAGEKLAECIRAIESTFSRSLAEKGGVRKLKTNLNSSYIILISLADEDLSQACKFVDKVIVSPLQTAHVISALKEYY